MPKLNGISIIGKRPTILQLSYGVERANTYVIEEDGHAILIDACSKDAAKELKKRNLSPDYLVLTHEHCDHLWGLNAIRSPSSTIPPPSHHKENCHFASFNSGWKKPPHDNRACF